MCFLLDCDWHASVVHEEDRTATKEMNCLECSHKIQPGDSYHYVYQQEHEECQACEWAECECPDALDGKDRPQDHECRCEKPNYGESYEYWRCQECSKFLKAVQRAEVDAGCSVYESQPHYEDMIDEISDSGMDEAKRYFKRAAKDFPEIVKSGYLGWLWRKMF
jgi:hypothetical protein